MLKIVRWLLIPALLVMCMQALRADDATIIINGKPLTGVHYIEREGILLLPLVPIATALGRTAHYAPDRHLVTVEGHDYPIIVEDLDQPQAVLDNGTLYVDWRFMHGVFSTMQLGQGSQGVVLSCRVLDAPKVTMSEPIPEPTPETVFYVNNKDKRHRYHVLGCPLLAKDAADRYEITDPKSSNFFLRRDYGKSIVLFTPCPVCILKDKAAIKAAEKAESETPKATSPHHTSHPASTHSPKPAPTASASPAPPPGPAESVSASPSPGGKKPATPPSSSPIPTHDQFP